MKKIALVISCEHAVNSIPSKYQTLFDPYKELLTTHRGIDFGALEIAQHVKKNLVCDLVTATTSRLLIDCNRSLSHKHCFSEVTQHVSAEEQQRLIEQYYQPFREEVMGLIKKHITQGMRVWHLSMHSFTPVMNGIVRNADAGLLYDPRRASEKNLARLWQKELKKQAPQYRVRCNYPYTGISDGFTVTLRQQWSQDEYVGIELESNQALTLERGSLEVLKDALSSTLLTCLKNAS